MIFLQAEEEHGAGGQLFLEPPLSIPAKQFFPMPPGISGNGIYDAQLPFWAAGQIPFQAALQPHANMVNLQRMPSNMNPNFFRMPRGVPRGMYPRGRGGIQHGMPMHSAMFQQGVSCFLL